MHSPRVVHLIDGLTIGGAELVLCRLVSSADARGADQVVIAFMEGGETLEQMHRAGVQVETLGLKRGRVSIRAFLLLRRRLVVLAPDIIVTWSATANLIGTVVARFCGSPRVIWNLRRSDLRRGDCSCMTAFAVRLCSFLSRRMKLIVANAAAARRAHEEMGYRPAAWRIIPNGFDLSEFRPDPAARADVRSELGLTAETPLIGIAGRWNPVKDHATFVRAAEALHAERPDVHFLMAGEGLTAGNGDLSRVASHLLDSGVLHLLGARQDMPRLMAALDLFALTSLGEGFPNVVGEAMACGIPCVVTRTAGNAVTVVGQTGLVVPPGDPEALSNAWSRWLSVDEDVRRKMSRAVRDRIEKHYGVDLMRQRFEELYRAVCDGVS